jgi:hypothetical protein
MALFITRLLAASGVSIPTPSDHGFQDLGGSVAQQARNAINQLAILGIAEGHPRPPSAPGRKRSAGTWRSSSPALWPSAASSPGRRLLDVTPTPTPSSTSRARRSPVTTRWPCPRPVPFSIELWPASIVRSERIVRGVHSGTDRQLRHHPGQRRRLQRDKVTGIEPSGARPHLHGRLHRHPGRDRAGGVHRNDADRSQRASQSDAKTPTNDAVGSVEASPWSSRPPRGAFGPVTVDSVDKANNGRSLPAASPTSGTQRHVPHRRRAGDDGAVGCCPDHRRRAAGQDPPTHADPAGSSIFDLLDESPVAPGLSWRP